MIYWCIIYAWIVYVFLFEQSENNCEIIVSIVNKHYAPNQESQ